ncbi:MAG TPA: ATP-binding protein [Prolixibacteraceae bacterium]|jgi:hypothetical protein
MRKIRNHKRAALVQLGILIISIFTLLFAASISFKRTQSLTDSEQLIIHSYDVNLELIRLLSTVKEAETSERGFILTNDSTFLIPYSAAENKVRESFVKLKLLVFNNPGQGRNLDTLFFLINQRLALLQYVLSQNASHVYTHDSYRKPLRRGKELMTTIQVEADRIAAYELNLLREHEQEHERDLRLSPLTILFIVFFSLAFFMVAYFKINKDLKHLAQSNNQLLINKEIFEHSEHIANISHWWWDINKHSFSYSPNQYRLMGCTPGDFKPTLEQLVDYVHPDDRTLIREVNKRALEEIVPSVVFYRIIKKDGELRRFICHGKVISDHEGKTFIIGVNTDITEQYNKDKMIADQITALEKSNYELSAFNHIASHDLQEPLRKVQIFISRIRDKIDESLPEQVKDYFFGIERATNRMQLLIEDLLLYSRVSHVEKIVKLTDLNQILENAKEELSQQIEEKNGMISVSSPLPTLDVIPFQIQQLFYNLLSNAIKYSKPGDIPHISIHTRLVSSIDLVALKGIPKGKYYEISISDNGIGFEPLYADDIFKLFYRLHNKSEYTGTGVGLAICKLIVENHNGMIRAESTPNLGSTFTFYLPAHL